MAEQQDSVLEQWDLIKDAGELWDLMLEAFVIAGDLGDDKDFNGANVGIHVVPCVPGETIPAGAAITGLKLARINGRLGIYLFAEGAA